MGPKERHSYSTATKLTVIDYNRLRYNDGGLVGSRGAVTGLGQGLRPERIWKCFKPGRRSVKRQELEAGRQRRTSQDPCPRTLADYINDCCKQSLVVTPVVVMRKFVVLKPDAFGGIPSSSDSGATERFHRQFAKWNQTFYWRNKFSIRRKTSVGQKKPNGWEGMWRGRRS